MKQIRSQIIVSRNSCKIILLTANCLPRYWRCYLGLNFLKVSYFIIVRLSLSRVGSNEHQLKPFFDLLSWVACLSLRSLMCIIPQLLDLIFKITNVQNNYFLRAEKHDGWQRCIQEFKCTKGKFPEWKNTYCRHYTHKNRINRRNYKSKYLRLPDWRQKLPEIECFV